MIFVCAGIETNVGIICGCLPGIKPLLNQLFPKAFAPSTEVRTFKEFSSRRLRGARLSIHLPPRAHFQRPSSSSMVEVPVKLDQQWNPLESPRAVPLRTIRYDERTEHDAERQEDEAGVHLQHSVDHHENHAAPDLERQDDEPHTKRPTNETHTQS
jgi:hypothetical protein